MQWAREQLQTLPRPWVAIHPFASKAERNWPAERYAEVVIQSTSRWHCGILFTGGNSPVELGLV
jgi:heptosyltransferase I